MTADTVVFVVRCRPVAGFRPKVVDGDRSVCRSAVSIALAGGLFDVADDGEVKEAKTGTPAPVVRLGISGRVAPTYAGVTEATRSNLTSTPV